MRKVELDPIRLRAVALSGLPLSKMSPAAWRKNAEGEDDLQPRLRFLKSPSRLSPGRMRQPPRHRSLGFPVHRLFRSRTQLLGTRAPMIWIFDELRCITASVASNDWGERRLLRRVPDL